MGGSDELAGSRWRDKLTSTGWGWLALAAAALVAGWASRYSEVIAFGAVMVGVLVFSFVGGRRSSKIDIHQRLAAHRVARGETVHAIVTVTNSSNVSTGDTAVTTRLDDETVSEPLPALAAGGRNSITLRIPTRRRGQFEVGPTRVHRSDPLGLTATTYHDSATDQVLVHPKIYELSRATGRLRTVDQDSSQRRIGTDPLSGFVSLREYIQGDDPRLIHWPTTARAGSLMVKETVDFHRPEFTLVVDAAARSATADIFEEIVDVAATLAAHAFRTGLTVVIRTTNRRQPGAPDAMTQTGEMLDFMTMLGQSDGTDVVSLVGLFTRGFDATNTLLVTGPNGPSSTVAGNSPINTVFVGTEDVTRGPNTMTVVDAADFAQRWKGMG